MQETRNILAKRIKTKSYATVEELINIKSTKKVTDEYAVTFLVSIIYRCYFYLFLGTSISFIT